MVFQARLISSKGVVAYFDMVVSAHRPSRPAAMMVIRSARPEEGGVGRRGSMRGAVVASRLDMLQTAVNFSFLLGNIHDNAKECMQAEHGPGLLYRVMTGRVWSPQLDFTLRTRK